ncbi:hypothetical protein BB560_003939 [Smittium megazygosporum]|uniref:GDT1 family protein n=1 Tax=Smittium megazygosporum TaxID=133381 RepID=A0A2T9ZAP9_9FUNG|nr:hypothetical protein BB560_003939 [Smittium megazygosporum]
MQFKNLCTRTTLFILSVVLLSVSAQLDLDPTRNDNPKIKEPNQLATSSLSTSGFSDFSAFERYKEGFLKSVLMVLVSEIGDKTFLIAAIYAMRHSRFTIFSASCAALWVMSLLSALLGNLAFNFVSQNLVSLLASITFIIFGVKMGVEAKQMESDEISKEYEALQAELLDMNPSSTASQKTSTLSDLEAGTLNSDSLHTTEDFSVKITDSDFNPSSSKNSNSNSSNNSSSSFNILVSISNFFSFILSPTFVQVFIMVFLAEWGDRSQLATIALGASSDLISVTLGTILGHTFCTAVAVIGGRYLAQMISPKVLTAIGSVMFIVFSFMYLYEFLYL